MLVWRSSVDASSVAGKFEIGKLVYCKETIIKEVIGNVYAAGVVITEVNRDWIWQIIWYVQIF